MSRSSSSPSPSSVRLEGGKLTSEGKQYDATGPGVLPHVQAFVTAYAIPLEQLLEPDLTQYPTFNAFFARRLRADARPLASPDPHVLTCPADCRLSVFESVDAAKALWWAR